jgi:single-strand DNA-binding protein
MGRATSSIELKQTQAGKSVVNFSLAVKRPYTKDTTDFFNICAWDKTAELLAKYVKKGDQICIRGYLTNREWSDKNGNKRISTEIIAEEISFAGNKESSTEPKNNAPAQAHMPTGYATQTQAQFEDIPSGEDLPF